MGNMVGAFFSLKFSLIAYGWMEQRKWLEKKVWIEIEKKAVEVNLFEFVCKLIFALHQGVCQRIW